jgi:hypothetical protein
MKKLAADQPIATGALTAVILAALLLLAPPSTGHAQVSTAPPACQATQTAGPADTLASVSNSYFGTAAYGRAILQATNARAGTSGFKYVSNPNQLPAGAAFCIPALPEADRRRLRYEAYQQAVNETVLPKPSEVSQSLVKVPSGPVHVSTWIRPDEMSRYKPGGNWITTAQKDIWVTVIPEIKSFCQAFVKDHNADAEQLTLRLEQHLGLPPGAGKTSFLEIVVADPSNTTNLFRPCQNPSATTVACAAGPPASANAQYAGWFYQQYYGSFAQAQPDQYPWTSLGYTFDWASREDGTRGFVRYGASEFVIPKGAPIEIVGATDTAPYCQP